MQKNVHASAYSPSLVVNVHVNALCHYYSAHAMYRHSHYTPPPCIIHTPAAKDSLHSIKQSMAECRTAEIS